MSPFEIGLYSLGGIVVLVYLGFWVPFALMLSSYIGVWLIKDSSVLAKTEESFINQTPIYDESIKANGTQNPR